MVCDIFVTPFPNMIPVHWHGLTGTLQIFLDRSAASISVDMLVDIVDEVPANSGYGSTNLMAQQRKRILDAAFSSTKETAASGWELWGWLFVTDTHTFIVRNNDSRDHVAVEDAVEIGKREAMRPRAHLILRRKCRGGIYDLPVDVRRFIMEKVVARVRE